MYFIDDEFNPVVIVKHLEDHLFAEITNNSGFELKKEALFGLYIGHVSGVSKIHNLSKYDFIIAPPSISALCRKKGFKKPILALSGFNFLPNEFFDLKTDTINPKTAVYVGNFQRRKALKDALYIGRNWIAAGQFDRLVLFVRVSNWKEGLIRYVLHCIFRKCEWVSFPIRGFSCNFSRQEVIRAISECAVVVAPYIAEGAARVVAEAESLGKPVMIYKGMQGGTQDFLVEAENYYYEGNDDVGDLSVLSPKNRDEKKVIYCAENNALKLNKFLRCEFNVFVNLTGSSLVNALSAHRNEISARYTREADDQITSVEKMLQFLQDFGLATSPSTPFIRSKVVDLGVFVGITKRAKSYILHMQYLIKLMVAVVSIRFLRDEPRGKSF